MENVHINTQNTQERHLLKRPDIDSYSREVYVVYVGGEY